MELFELLQADEGIKTAHVSGAAINITGLTADSRQVRPGFLFAALPGARVDGRAFIDEAVANGAAAVLTAPDPPLIRRNGAGGSVPIVTAGNPRRGLARLAARFFGRQPETVAAVTGTNGKTSVVSFLRQLWAFAGRPAASLGTLGIDGPGVARAGSLTTPDPVALHAELARLADAGITCLAMEASSHGLDQFRLDGVRVGAAAFTNLTRDHLDYHGSLDAYRAAKRRLFADLLSEDGSAVVNADSTEGAAMAEAARARGIRVRTFGRAGDVRVDGVVPIAGGQRLTLTVDGVRHEVPLPLVGDFQASNAVCALTLGLVTGLAADIALAGLESLQPAPGRLQKAATTQAGAPIFVDYAHTPDALANALAALRPACAGRLVVVFGCGGDRDAGKRPEMGCVAAGLADRVYVTDDNPRGEDPTAIRRAILVGCPRAVEIGDRAEAIAEAVARLEKDDVLLVAGKGHEQGQIVGERVVPFDDVAVVQAVAATCGAG